MDGNSDQQTAPNAPNLPQNPFDPAALLGKTIRTLKYDDFKIRFYATTMNTESVAVGIQYW